MSKGKQFFCVAIACIIIFSLIPIEALGDSISEGD